MLSKKNLPDNSDYFFLFPEYTYQFLGMWFWYAIIYHFKGFVCLFTLIPPRPFFSKIQYFFFIGRVEQMHLKTSLKCSSVY